MIIKDSFKWQELNSEDKNRLVMLLQMKFDNDDSCMGAEEIERALDEYRVKTESEESK